MVRHANLQTYTFPNVLNLNSPARKLVCNFLAKEFLVIHSNQSNLVDPRLGPPKLSDNSVTEVRTRDRIFREVNSNFHGSNSIFPQRP